MNHPPPSPPPPPHQPPHQPPPHGAGWQPVVGLNPEAAGMVRTERRGWALILATAGALIVLVSFALPWVNISAGSSDFSHTSKDASPLFVISTINDLITTSPDYKEPPVAVAMYFQWGMLLLTLITIAVTFAAARGLRRRSATALTRVGGVVLALLAAGLTAGALVLIDDRVELSTAAIDQAWEAGGVTSSYIEVFFGPVVWYIGIIVLCVAAGMGPRIVFQPPAGATGQLAPGSAYAGASSGPLMTQPGQVMRRVHLPAMVLMPLGAVLAFASYTFVPWNSEGPTVVFSDLSKAARNDGFDAHPFTEQYFSWLGWLILLVSVVAAGAVFLGRKPLVKPQILRPVLTVAMIVCMVLHLVGIAELDQHGLAAFLLIAALGLSVIGAALPWQTTVGWMPGQPGPSGHPGPPVPPGPPGWTS